MLTLVPAAAEMFSELPWGHLAAVTWEAWNKTILPLSSPGLCRDFSYKFNSL
jgi:hypothetical protein